MRVDTYGLVLYVQEPLRECGSSFSSLGVWSLFSVCLESIGHTFFSLKMFQGWKGCFGKRSNGEIWIAIPLGLMWYL